MAKAFKGEWKTITLNAMMEYIEENAPQDKAWFKKIAFETKSGKKTKKYNHLNARKQFCSKYAPELIPVKKAKEEKASDKLMEW